MAEMRVVFIIKHLDEKNSSGLFGPFIYKFSIKGIRAVWCEVFLTTMMWGFVLW
jgi:hypothetical protein